MHFRHKYNTLTAWHVYDKTHGNTLEIFIMTNVYMRKDMPEQLDAAIKRCQINEPVHPTASSIVNSVTGEIASYSAPNYN